MIILLESFLNWEPFWLGLLQGSIGKCTIRASLMWSRIRCVPKLEFHALGIGYGISKYMRKLFSGTIQESEISAD
jgi:hypothetical protein